MSKRQRTTSGSSKNPAEADIPEDTLSCLQETTPRLHCIHHLVLAYLGGNHQYFHGHMSMVIRDHSRGIHDVVVLSGGDLLLVLTWHGANVWNMRTGECVRAINATNCEDYPQINYTMCLKRATVLEDGRVVSAGERIEAHEGAATMVWNKDMTKVLLWQPQLGTGVHVSSVEPLGRVVWLVSVHPHTGIRMTESVCHGEEAQEPGSTVHTQGHPAVVWCVCVLPDGTILSASEDNTVKVWDAVTGMCKLTMQGHTERVRYLVIMADGTVASAADDATVRVWDVATGVCRKVLRKFPRGIHFLKQLLDGYLAVGDYGGMLHLWDLARTQCVQALHHVFNGDPAGPIDCVVEMGDGRLATCAYNGPQEPTDIWVWAQGVLQIRLQGHRDRILILKLLPTGGLVSASRDSTIILWA